MRTSTIFLPNKLLKSAGILLFWLLIWQLAASAVGKALILPGPILVIKTLFSLCGNSAFWLSAGASLLRISLGFLTGILIGGLLAVCTSASQALNDLLSPLIRVIRATPVASFIILILLWVSRALVPAVIAALMVIPVIWSSLHTAIGQTDSQLLEMANAYGFSSAKKLRLVYIPAVLPQFISACLTAQGLAWKSGIAAEVLCLPSSSVGTQLYYSKIYLETPSLFAWTALVVFLSFALEKLCKYAFSRINIHFGRSLFTARETTQQSSFSGLRLKSADLSLSYDGTPILKDLNLDLPLTGITCFSGASGCGKTSLMRIFAGLTAPDSGSLEGVPTSVGILFQEDRLLPWLTARENVAAVAGWNRAAELLCTLSLGDDMDKYPAELSGGMCRRVALARALALPCSLLILDEPFKGLDAALVKDCARVIKTLDIPVFLVTHSAQEAELLGGQVVHIQTDTQIM